jgi:hypothetical protein
MAPAATRCFLSAVALAASPWTRRQFLTAVAVIAVLMLGAAVLHFSRWALPNRERLPIEPPPMSVKDSQIGIWLDSAFD